MIKHSAGTHVRSSVRTANPSGHSVDYTHYPVSSAMLCRQGGANQMLDSQADTLANLNQPLL